MSENCRVSPTARDNRFMLKNAKIKKVSAAERESSAEAPKSEEAQI